MTSYPHAVHIGQTCFPQFLSFDRFCGTMIAPDRVPPRHRTHISRMRLDRYKRLVEGGTFTMFVQGAGSSTVPLGMFSRDSIALEADIQCFILVVNNNTTTTEIMEILAKRRLIPSNFHEDYLLASCKSRKYRIPGWETMGQLGIGSLGHLHLRVKLLGGSSKSVKAGRPHCRLALVSHVWPSTFYQLQVSVSLGLI